MNAIKQVLRNVKVFLYGRLCDAVKRKGKQYIFRYNTFSFSGTKCNSFQSYEAVITRLYHTVEKGLSYEGENYRPGFGKETIKCIITTMNEYITRGYSSDAMFYRTSLDTLHTYISKNREYGWSDAELEQQILSLPGIPNGMGGTITISSPEDPQSMSFKELMESRHSVRWFAEEEIDEETVKEAIRLAQLTPSACNRQGWSTVVIKNKEMIREVLNNQNGNAGFGDRIRILLLITVDLRYFNKDRELFQPFIDGGMYAQNVLNALAYYGFASVPLSASLTEKQEKNVRQLLGLNENDEPILFIGVGKYNNTNTTTRSERKEAEIRIV